MVAGSIGLCGIQTGGKNIELRSCAEDGYQGKEEAGAQA